MEFCAYYVWILMWILCEYRLYYTETEMSLFWWNSPSEVKLTNSNETNDENFVKMTTLYVLMLLFFVISLSFIFMVESDTFSMNMFVILCNDILFATCLVSVCVSHEESVVLLCIILNISYLYYWYHLLNTSPTYNQASAWCHGNVKRCDVRVCFFSERCVVPSYVYCRLSYK